MTNKMNVGDHSNNFDTVPIKDDEILNLIKRKGLNLIRIGCIQEDGSSFLHALIKSFYRFYSESSNIYFKRNIIFLLRKGFAELVNEKDYYKKLEEGTYNYLAHKNIVIKDLSGTKIRFSPEDLYDNLKKNKNLSSILFNPIANYIGINFIIVDVDDTNNSLISLWESKEINSDYFCLILSLDTKWKNYELVGLKVKDGIKVLFHKKDYKILFG